MVSLSINISTMPPNYGTTPTMGNPNNIPLPSPNSRNKRPLGLYADVVVLIILLVASLCFGYWAFSQMKDYKNNSDQKSAIAVKKANEEQKKQLQLAFDEQEKSPFKSYTGPSQFGSVYFTYPKSWSAYIVEQEANSSLPVDGYFYPNFVPGVSQSKKANFILRIQINNKAYKSELDQFNTSVKQGKVRVSPYVPEQLKNASPGVRIDGQLFTDKRGSMIIVPVRDKVLKIWTENESTVSDYNNVIKSLTYSP